jgi:hypothetical protein
MADPSGVPEVSLSLLATGVLLSLVGPVAVKVLERLMGGAPAWVWRLAAFLCLIAGWAIVLLNDPVKAQAKLHPKGFGLATVIVLILAVLLVRSRVFNIAPAQQQELDITFDESGKGFVHPFTDKSLDPKNPSIVDWKRYRVALRSRLTAPGTRLIAVDITLKGGDNYPSLPLRIMGNPEAMEFKLHAGIPHLWNVVEKPVGSDWIRLTQKTVPEFIVQVPYSFKMTASCDQGFSVSKLVTLDVDGTNNNELMLRLDDVEV